jgi:F-type H+-transporting ATPase subunit delta
MYEYLDRRYALALYDIAEKKGKVDEYIDNIRDIVELMEENSELYKLLKRPQISTVKKKKTFEKIFKGRIDDELLSFFFILIDKHRILFLKEKLRELEKIRLEKSNIILAEVKTVIPLVEEERQTLREKLEHIYGKSIIFTETVDRSILGGVYVRVGNDVIDGTLKAKLNEMKELILSTADGKKR